MDVCEREREREAVVPGQQLLSDGCGHMLPVVYIDSQNSYYVHMLLAKKYCLKNTVGFFFIERYNFKTLLFSFFVLMFIRNILETLVQTLKVIIS
jgi:hypothetical protein